MNDSRVEVGQINRIRRMANRASYLRSDLYAIIDDSPVCTVSFLDSGRVMAVPMAHWRIGDKLYVHGANKGRFEQCCAGSPICVTIVHFDGYVLARSAYNHSMNYRSVVVHGTANAVSGEERKTEVLRAFIEAKFPGRWDTLRPIKQNELTATVILELPLDCLAAKVRSGPSGDEADDPEWNSAWTGVIPYSLSPRGDIPEVASDSELGIPPYAYRQGAE